MTTNHDNLEQPPAGKIVETRTVYSVSDTDPPISRQQDAAKPPTLAQSDKRRWDKEQAEVQDAAREQTETPRTEAVRMIRMLLETRTAASSTSRLRKFSWMELQPRIEETLDHLVKRELASATAALAEERAAREEKVSLDPNAKIPRWTTSWPPWFPVFGNTEVVSAIDYDNLEQKFVAATTALAEERALKDALANAVNAANVLAFERKQQLEAAEAELAKAKHENKECWHYKALWQQAADERDALALSLVASREECAKVCEDEDEDVPLTLLADRIRALPSPSRERGEALLRELEFRRQSEAIILEKLRVIDSAIKEGRGE